MHLLFPHLTTERLQLREVTYHDARALLDALGDINVMRHFGAPVCRTKEDVYELIDLYHTNWGERTGLRFSITVKPRDRAIGLVGLHSWNHALHQADVACLLARAHWGHGYMQEALQAVIQYGFEQMKLERLRALVEPPNLNSRKLFARLDFHEVGRLNDGGVVYVEMVRTSERKRVP